MEMLTLLPLPDHKLHHHLREERLHPPPPKVPLGVKRQAVLLIPRLVKHILQPLAREGTRRLPCSDTPIAVRRRRELERGV